MPSIQWLTPAVLWPVEGAMARPWLVELSGERFLPDFLDLMQGRVPEQTPANLRDRAPALTDGRLKLYQPLHDRYYLVTGSLVCRQVGLPDRAVARKDGERTSFVLRRWPRGAASAEHGWVADGPLKGWRAAASTALLEGEERLPLHDVGACVPARVGATGGCEERAIYYGYVPVDSREKYLSRLPDPAAALASFPAPAAGEVAEPDPRLSDFEARVLRTWRGLYVDPVTNLATSAPEQNPTGSQLAEVSLYLLLDLGDFLRRVLPDVFAAATSPTGTVAGSGKAALLAALRDIRINLTGGVLGLDDALAELEPFLPLLQGRPPTTGASAQPPHTYDVKAADRDDPDVASPSARRSLDSGGASYLRPIANDGRLYQLVASAIADGAAPIELPPELADMIKSDPPDAGADADRYVLRLVYEYDPCPAILSEPSAPFRLAKALDPDAPARHVRVELPSLKDLRKFKRGVAMEMPPDLRSLMDRVNKGMLDGGGLGPAMAGEWQLGMICSFSIPIITLVAFIVMFIFLILFNFIFWWLPFLKICFPIPTRK